MSAPRAETRNPLVIVGGIRELAERLRARFTEPSYSVDRLVELADELERALTIQQFQNSLAVSVERRARCSPERGPRVLPEARFYWPVHDRLRWSTHEWSAQGYRRQFLRGYVTGEAFIWRSEHPHQTGRGYPDRQGADGARRANGECRSAEVQPCDPK
jgi:hypothetical protein